MLGKTGNSIIADKAKGFGAPRFFSFYYFYYFAGKSPTAGEG